MRNSKLKSQIIFLCVFSVRFQEVLLRRMVFSLMRKEELIPNADDWVYKVAKNREALQEGGTLRYCITVYLRCLK